MSLELAAKHIAHKGRGPDTTLVHMSRDEVKSLNDLAMAHGGQLTINPQTGLPEAGFLSSILPMVAGAGLMAVSGGAINPMTAGLLVGGGSYLMNPNKGLMGALSAGLGAYGGAGLAGGLSGLATSEAGLTAQTAATEGAQQEVARQTAQQQAQQQLAMNSGYANIDPGVVTPSALPADQLATIKSNIVNEQLLANPPPTGFDAVKQGAKSLYDNPTADKFKAIGGGSYSGLARMGLAAAAPAITEPAKFTPPPTSATAGKQVVPHYKFSPGMQTPTPTASPTGVENVYFKPQYTALSDEEAKQMYPGYGAYVPQTAADGGLMGYAGGGPVEQMSNDNAIGANTGFPQAYLHNNAYATPYQTPISQNVLMGAGDVSVDPYTGEQRMAAGGVSYDPQTQRYTGGIADAIKPENRDVNIYNDTGGPGSGGGPASSGAPSSSTGQGVSNTAQSVGLGMMGLGQAPGVVSGLAGLIGQAIVDGQLGSMSDVAAAIAAANAGGHSVTSDASGNVSVSPGPSSNGMGVATDGSDGGGASGGGDGGAPGMGGDARGGYLSHGRFDQRPRMAMGGISDAGYNLGGYSDGGRLLRGPGDGVSDSIPAVIGKKQPARLADGEFVVPARIVSELGNGSTEAGARKLYAMMDRIQAARGKTVGKGRVAKNSRSEKYLPA